MDAHQFKNWCIDYHRGERVSPLMMGILNATPDSFSDGHPQPCQKDFIEHALTMVHDGADLLDIGGESTRPGAQPVSLKDELERVIPLIKELRRYTDICISVDTYKAEVMKQALDAGANIINDINGLRCPAAAQVVIEHQVPVCIMHMKGHPQTMQDMVNPQEHMVSTVQHFFQERIQTLVDAGLLFENLILDPGIGFGKTVQQNLNLIQHLETYLSFKCPILLGVSRKSVVGYVLNRPVHQRLAGSLSLNVIGYLNGARIFRTHDVQATMDAVNMANQYLLVERFEENL